MSMDMTTRILLELSERVSQLDRDLKILDQRLTWEHKELMRLIGDSKPKGWSAASKLFALKVAILAALVAAQVPIRQAMTIVGF